MVFFFYVIILSLLDMIFGLFDQESLINAMNDELSRIQEQVYFGQINSRTDVLDKFLSESGFPRYNPQVILSGIFSV